jgi:hypothetical protein
VLEASLAGISALELTQVHDRLVRMLGLGALASSVARWVFPRGERPIDDGFDRRKRQRKNAA